MKLSLNVTATSEATSYSFMLQHKYNVRAKYLLLNSTVRF